MLIKRFSEHSSSHDCAKFQKSTIKKKYRKYRIIATIQIIPFVIICELNTGNFKLNIKYHVKKKRRITIDTKFQLAEVAASLMQV